MAVVEKRADTKKLGERSEEWVVGGNGDSEKKTGKGDKVTGDFEWGGRKTNIADYHSEDQCASLSRHWFNLGSVAWGT